jgi:hypothetical protein
MNLADLRRTLGVGDDDMTAGSFHPNRGHSSQQAEADEDGLYGADSKARLRRLSMERMDLLKVCSLSMDFCFCLMAGISVLFCFILFKFHFGYLFLRLVFGLRMHGFSFGYCER